MKSIPVSRTKLKPRPDSNPLARGWYIRNPDNKKYYLNTSGIWQRGTLKDNVWWESKEAALKFLKAASEKTASQPPVPTDTNWNHIDEFPLGKTEEHKGITSFELFENFETRKIFIIPIWDNPDEVHIGSINSDGDIENLDGNTVGWSFADVRYWAHFTTPAE